jgi:hypothetical protein
MYESRIEKFLLNEVRKRGGLALKTNANASAGLPDRMILFPERIVLFVEIKRADGYSSALQIKRQGQLRGLGFPVYEVRTKDQIIELLERVKPI